MRKVIVTLAVAFAAMAGGASQALADGGDHNCAGTASSGAAQALGAVFGDIVSDFAQLGVVDNLGLANCGNANGSNP